MKLTKEYWIRINLDWFTWKSGIKRVKVLKDKGSKGLGEALPLSHGVQSRPPCFLNSWWRLGAAESKLYLKYGQWFIAKGFVSTWSLTNLTFTKWSNRISYKHSSNLTVGLGWQYSYYTYYRVFNSIHTLTQTDMKKFVQKCLIKISLSSVQYSNQMLLHLSAGESWALRTSREIPGPTISIWQQILSIATWELASSGRSELSASQREIAAHWSPRDLKGPHSGLLFIESQDDWFQSSVNLHPGCNPRR